MFTLQTGSTGAEATPLTHLVRSHTTMITFQVNASYTRVFTHVLKELSIQPEIRMLGNNTNVCT